MGCGGGYGMDDECRGSYLQCDVECGMDNELGVVGGILWYLLEITVPKGLIFIKGRRGTGIL